MATFDTAYGDVPWSTFEDVTDKTRDVFVPDLIDVFRRERLFSQFVPFAVDMTGAEIKYFTTMYELEPNVNPLGLRDVWLDSQSIDSERKYITMEHHGGKVTLHKYDDYINQWRLNGMSGLRAILVNKLGVSMVRHLDLLARNAFLSGSWHLTGSASLSEGHDFSTLATDGSDDFDPDVISDIWLGMESRGMHGAVDYNGAPGTMIAITSPGVIYSIQKNSDWITAMQFADPGRLLRYEVGMYKNTRFISSPDMNLYNAGVLNGQWPITAALHPNGGAARNVDANREVGQENLPTGAQRYVQLDANNLVTGLADDLTTLISPGDVITLHKARTTEFGINQGSAMGVDWRDGNTIYRRVVSVDNTTKRISLDRPVLQDFQTDLGGGVYGYVSIGQNVAATMFLTGPNAVVSAVTQPPQTYAPPVIDDTQSFYRFTWDAYLKFQIWNDYAVEVVFNTAPYRIKGVRR